MADNIKQYDVVIVGAGLVGATLALALSSLKLKIAVIESFALQSGDLTPGYNDRSIALSHGSSLIYQGLGLWPALSNYTSRIDSIHVSDKGYFGAARLYAEQEKLPALGYLIETKFFGHVLLNTLLAGNYPAAIDILSPASLQSIKENGVESNSIDGDVNDDVDDTLTLHLEGESQEGMTLQTRLLIGTDGEHSSVRKLSSINAEQVSYEQTAIIANVSTQRPHQHRAYERFTSKGPIALLPLNHEQGSGRESHRSALVWTQPVEQADRIAALDDEVFLTELTQDFGHRLGRFTKAGKRTAYPLSLSLAEKQTARRTVVLGNASHALHPVAGQGLNLALRDIAVMADLIAEASVKDIGSLGTKSMLETYESLRHKDILDTAAYTHNLVSLFSNQLPLLGHVRASGMMAVDRLKPMRDWFTGRSMGKAYRQSRLARGLSLQPESLKHQKIAV